MWTDINYVCVKSDGDTIRNAERVESPAPGEYAKRTGAIILKDNPAVEKFFALFEEGDCHVTVVVKRKEPHLHNSGMEEFPKIDNKKL